MENISRLRTEQRNPATVGLDRMTTADMLRVICEENKKVLIPFLKRVRSELPEKDIWLYSGYTYEMLQGEEIL